MLLFGVGALAWTHRQTPVYLSEASLEFQSDNSQTSLLGTRTDTGGETPDQRAAINALTITRREVLTKAQKILKNKWSVAQLQAKLSAHPETGTNLVVIQARASKPLDAQALAGALADAAAAVTRADSRKRYAQAAGDERQLLKRLERDGGAKVSQQVVRQQIAQYDELSRVIDPVVIRRYATPAGARISPNRTRTVLLALLVGLTFGLLAAFLRDALDRRFKSSRELAEELQLPLLAQVDEGVLGKSIAAKRSRGLSAQDLEEFRILRTNIEFLDVDDPPSLVVVTSALPEEGKSTVATGLAAANASAGKRTVLVEADLRKPTMAARIGLEPMPGLTDVLAGNAEPADVLQPVADPQLAQLLCITAGTPAPAPAELLRSRRCADFLEQLQADYDVVVVDTTPLLSVADALELLPVASAVVMCVRATRTTREQGRAARAALAHVPQRPAGLVITGVRAGGDESELGYYPSERAYGAGAKRAAAA